MCLTCLRLENSLLSALSSKSLQITYASDLADAGAGIDVVADLLGHASVQSSRVYVHPSPGRLRAAVDKVPSPREQARPGK
jgi:site-specific recombinase XerD